MTNCGPVVTHTYPIILISVSGLEENPACVPTRTARFKKTRRGPEGRKAAADLPVANSPQRVKLLDAYTVSNKCSDNSS
jgi:hypothetical protein